MTYEQAVVRGIGIGFLLAALLVIYVFATGQTFGQRCHKMHPNGDDKTISACVHQLSHQN